MQTCKCLSIFALLFLSIAVIFIACGGGGGDGGDGTLSDGLKIFVTSEGHVGDFAGDPTLTGANAIEKADYFCNQDPNKPNDSIYKALLVDGTLRDAVTLTDWVLQPNTTYYRSYNNIEIGTTINTAIFPAFYTDLTNSVVEGEEFGEFELYVWTGIVDASDFTAGDDCSDWSSGFGTGSIGSGYSTSGRAFYSAYTACFNHDYLYCVEQP